MFFPEEVNLILSIPLSFFYPHDELIWIKEPKGVFMTKSTYFVARTCSDICGDVPVGSEMLVEIKFLWKALWRAKVPGKIKICIWMGCLNALLTKVNLKLKKVVLDDYCVICGTVPETIEHIMLQCPHARATWFASSLGLHPMQQGDVGLQDWVAKMAFMMFRESFDLVVMLMWNIWKACNELLWRGSTLPTQELQIQAWVVGV
ncbi:hypothetical protein ACFX1Z_022720 [Malus domestica]